MRVCKDYHTRIAKLEDEKFDLEYVVKRKDMEVAIRTTAVLYFDELTKLTKLLFNVVMSKCVFYTF